MAAPTAPTQLSLATEGLKQGGTSNPSSTALTRAYDWMEEIKNDLAVNFGGKKLKALYTSSVLILTEGQSRYSNPTDYFSDMEIDLMIGSVYGTAQTGAVGSITVASTQTLDTSFIGKNVIVTSGTGAGSMSQTTAINDSTKVVTVTPNFTTAPAASSGYMFIDSYYKLDQKPVWELSDYTQQTAQGRPTHYFPIGDVDYGEFELRPVPYISDDRVYGIRMKYYANLMTADLTGTLVATLYQKWRNLWIQGVKARSLEDRKQTEAETERQKYNVMLQQIIARETYGMDLSNLRCRVTDY